MKKIILAVSLSLLISRPLLANQNCLIIKENNKSHVSEGACDVRHAPRCSFNIAISLMTFNEGILSDEKTPELPFKEGYLDYVERWKQPHNPSLWIKNSCVWYSHLLTKQLGQHKLQSYVKQFKYGNQDFSGDKDKKNVLTRSWMSDGSLAISSTEQIDFLQKLIDHKLELNAKSYTMTKNIIFVDELVDGWKLYGKTGTGSLPKSDGTLDETREGGWFVGWLEKDQRKIVFANYIEQDSQDLPAGGRAKELVKKRLIELVSR